MRGTTVRVGASFIALTFLSTCPVRGTTIIYQYPVPTMVISIHVPREGHDS